MKAIRVSSAAMSHAFSLTPRSDGHHLCQRSLIIQAISTQSWLPPTQAFTHCELILSPSLIIYPSSQESWRPINLSLVMPPLNPSSATEIVLSIIFGVMATTISGVTLWQGHRFWKIWREHRHRDGQTLSGMPIFAVLYSAWRAIGLANSCG